MNELTCPSAISREISHQKWVQRLRQFEKFELENILSISGKLEKILGNGRNTTNKRLENQLEVWKPVGSLEENVLSGVKFSNPKFPSVLKGR
jgi:hypothetical protein